MLGAAGRLGNGVWSDRVGSPLRVLAVAIGVGFGAGAAATAAPAWAEPVGVH
jgi:hypothetical protein